MKLEKLSLAELEQQSLLAYQQGRLVEAVHFGAQALKRAPANDMNRMRYAYFIEGVTIHEFRPEIKIALATCLKSDQIEHQRIWGAWSALLLKGPMYVFLFNEALEPQKYWKNIDALLNDDFFLLGVRKLLIINSKIETALKRLRHTLLGAAETDNMLRSKHLPLLAALGIQNFYNEYVWTITTEENERISALDPAHAAQVGILACYRPLHSYPQAKEWQRLYGKGPLESLIKTHICDHFEEKEIRSSLKAISSIKEETSQAVQAMYEENPYPRWHCIDRPFKHFPDITLDWLTAGCGTGRSISQLGVAFPNVNFTAIDLSRSSLAYAVRKTREADINNIDFYHCDILDVEKMGKTFDFIESSGVLHHMKNPIDGWRALLACLNPGGRMQIGLYSTLGRSDVLSVRRYIEEKSYKPETDDIRRLRTDMMALPADHAAHPITQSRDFCTTSECRDLVFHIQETTYTIPEIKNMLDALDLTFLGFKLNRREKIIYEQHYPGTAITDDLNKWHELEQKSPSLFAGMYKFFCCRKSEIDTPNDAWKALVQSEFLGAR